MILQIKKNQLHQLQRYRFPEHWRKNWSTEHLDRLLIATKNNQAVGRIGIYVNPFFQDQKVAFLGAFEVLEDYAITSDLLDQAIAYLSSKGYKQIIGPIDGSTWHSYRFRETTKQAAFFMEPNQPAWYPEHWRRYGFQTCQTFVSQQMSLAASDASFLTNQKTELDQKGIIVRKFNLLDAQGELEKLADFNLKAFQKNYLFSPITKEQFVNQYRKVVPFLDPDLILLAEDPNGLVGLAFGIPNHSDPKGSSIIIKTLARLPGRMFAGLGKHLSRLFIERARSKNYQTLIHALMRSDNPSLNISRSLGANQCSQYTLLKFY